MTHKEAKELEKTLAPCSKCGWELKKRKRPGFSLDAREKKCKKCGKTFIAATEHIYRERNKGAWYCSWTCYLHSTDKEAKVK